MSSIAAIESRLSPGARLQAVPGYQAAVRRGNTPANISNGPDAATGAQGIESQHLIRLADPHTGPWPESVFNNTLNTHA